MLSLIINILFSSIAYLFGTLTLSGMVSAILVGHIIWSLGGFGLWTILGIFFISSSFFTDFKEERKYHLHHLHEKQGKRDLLQVIANGGVGASCCVMYQLTNNPVFIIAAGVSLASITADTWGSELGVLSKKKPVSILTFKQVTTGLSGGITLFGTVASYLGALLISILFSTWFWLFIDSEVSYVKLMLIVSLFGLLGSLIDSYLGALIQVKYKCIECKIITEKPVHHELPCEKIKGIRLINNDCVNLLSTLIVTMVCLIVFL